MVEKTSGGAMRYDQHLVSFPWNDYELLDSGEHMKLERFGEIIVARPETQALWRKRRPELWKDTNAEFAQLENETRKGTWHTKNPVPESWQMSWHDARFSARLTGFKHVGVFPEQAPNWEWIDAHVRDVIRPASDVGRITSYIPNVLNLFGYTGIASVVTALAGTYVTHVDASKQSLDWAHENARLSGAGDDSIRWILDDALAFVKREARRGAIYDSIILDPPAFGRGARGEVWKIEEDFLPLLESLKKIFSEKHNSFFIVNGYAAGYASRAFAQAIESVFDDISGESGELHIKESSSERVLPSGIYVRFVR